MPIAVTAAALLFSLTAATRPPAPPRPDHPDLSGTWTLDLGASETAASPWPRIDVIRHHGSHLQINRTIVVGDTLAGGQLIRGDLTFTIDGTPQKNTLGPTTLVSTLRWDGAVLVMESKADGEQGAFDLVDRYRLSDDRQTLTIDRSITSEAGDLTEKLVHRRTG